MRVTSAIAQELHATADEVIALLRRRWALYVVLPVIVGSSLSVAIFSGSAAHEGAAESATPPTTPLSAQSSASSTSGDDSPADAAANASSNESATSGSTTNTSETNVTVNGQTMAVPTNGSTHTDLSTSVGNMSVDITHTSTSATDSSLNVSIRSSNETEAP